MAKKKEKDNPGNLEKPAEELTQPKTEEIVAPPGASKKKKYKPSFVFYKSYYEAFKHLKTNKEKVQLIELICEYSFTGELPEVCDTVLAVFSVIKENLDSCRAKYFASIKNGALGGRPKGTTKNNKNNSDKNVAKKPKVNLNDNDNDNENDNGNGNDNDNDNDNENDNGNGNDNDKENKFSSYNTHTYNINNNNSENDVCVKKENNKKLYPCHLNRKFKDIRGDCSSCKKRRVCQLEDFSDILKRDEKLAFDLVAEQNNLLKENPNVLAKATWVSKEDEF